ATSTPSWCGAPSSAPSTRWRWRGFWVGAASILARTPTSWWSSSRKASGPEETMDFRLTDEQIALRDTARKFAREVMLPVAAEHDRTAEFPAQVIARAWELGLINLTIPPELGGAGISHLEQALIAEELAAGCAGMATSMIGNDLSLLPILIGGNAEQ